MNVFQVIEKMRPIDQRLKYQIDKLVKTATTGSIGKILYIRILLLLSFTMALELLVSMLKIISISHSQSHIVFIPTVFFRC